MLSTPRRSSSKVTSVTCKLQEVIASKLCLHSLLVLKLQHDTGAVPAARREHVGAATLEAVSRSAAHKLLPDSWQSLDWLFLSR